MRKEWEERYKTLTKKKAWQILNDFHRKSIKQEKEKENIDYSEYYERGRFIISIMRRWNEIKKKQKNRKKY